MHTCSKFGRSIPNHIETMKAVLLRLFLIFIFTAPVVAHAKMKKLDFLVLSKVIEQTKLDYEDACVTTQNPKARVPVHLVPLLTPEGHQNLPG